MVKSKVRFDGLDVAAMVSYWNRVALGRRVINIYDGPNGESYIFKLDKGISGGVTVGELSESTRNGTTLANISNYSSSSTLLLLIESGVRFHTSHQPFENPGMPSQFCAKLRKHLRGLRLEQVTQLGKLDRVVHLGFGSGDAQRHSLMLEFYARGNIVLTNSSFIILSLLRSHEYKNNENKSDGKIEEGKEGNSKEEAVQVKVGHAYPVTYATTITPSATLEETTDNPKTETLLTAVDPLEWFQNQAHFQQQRQPQSQESQNDGKAIVKKNKSKKNDNHSSQNAWKTLLLAPASGVSYYGPALLEHCLRCADLWGVEKKYPHEVQTSGEWKKLQTILQTQGGKVLNEIQTQESKGYILYQPKKSEPNSKAKDEENNPIGRQSASPFDDKILLEFQPHLLKQHEGMPWLDYDTFDRAVDAFFSHLESQKRALRAEQQRAQAELKLEKIKLDQEQRVITLLGEQKLLQEQAQLVELHADMVEMALQVVNSALDSGMDWDQLEELVALEKTQNQNPVAMLIHKLDLEHDQMVLRLAREDVLCVDKESNNHDENEIPTFRDVTISLNETAHGNATALYAKYRASKEKSKKTVEASTKALESAEENAERQLAEAQKKMSKTLIREKRKSLWFEKFNWFVTTDNYLVLGGRDAQQNELLVKRYLRLGDAYLHADVHGAASCILRAKRRRDPATGKTNTIPLSSQALREAGNFTICRSSAWSSRMVTSAWWVESHQVSKTAPTGEYLTVGSFMVRGKKNFLPPSPLEMGLGVLFRLGDDDSILRHRNERRDFALMQMEDDEETPIGEDVRSATPNRVTMIGNPKADITVPEDAEASTLPVNATKLRVSTTYLTIAANSEDINMVNERDSVEPVVYEESPGEERNEDDTTANSQAKKGLSVKERRLIKKYGSLEAAREAEEQRRREEKSNKNAPETPSIVLSAANADNQANQKRGKKAKMKRIAKKYADQDDNDRALALLLLQGGEKEKRQTSNKLSQISEKGKEAAAETLAILTKDAAAVAENLPEAVRDALAKCVTVTKSNDETFVRWNKFDGEVLEQLQSLGTEEQMEAAANRLLCLKETSRIDNFSASLAGIIRTIKKYGHEGFIKANEEGGGGDSRRKNKVDKTAEAESWKETLAQEGIVNGDVEDEDIADDTAELNKLTGKPQNEDLVLFAVPVCAPYPSLSKYAYRVKLTPGNMKRGKAAKQCVEMFLKEGSKAAGVDHYHDLIKKVPDNEWVQAICGDVKISAAGAAKAIQRSKAKAKSTGGKKK